MSWASRCADAALAPRRCSLACSSMAAASLTSCCGMLCAAQPQGRMLLSDCMLRSAAVPSHGFEHRWPGVLFRVKAHVYSIITAASIQLLGPACPTVEVDACTGSARPEQSNNTAFIVPEGNFTKCLRRCPAVDVDLPCIAVHSCCSARLHVCAVVSLFTGMLTQSDGNSVHLQSQLSA